MSVHLRIAVPLSWDL